MAETNVYDTVEEKQRKALEAIQSGTTAATGAIAGSQAGNILSPYDVAGKQALDLYTKALTPGQQMAAIENTPGYAFGKDQLVKGINQQAAYAGKALSGMNVQNYVAPAIQKYSGDFYNQYLQSLQPIINTGANAARQSAQNATTSAGQQANILAAGGQQAADVLTTGAQQQIAVENLNFQKDQSAVDNEISKAKLTGTLAGVDTLDKLKLNADTQYQDRVLALERDKQNLSARDFELRQTALENEQDQWEYKIGDAKAANILAMIDNGNLDINNLTSADRSLLSEYKGVPMNMPFTSAKEMNDKVNKLNFVWQGLQNGLISGDAAMAQIADAYGIVPEQINLPEKKDEIIDSYMTSMIALGKEPDLANLNKIITGFNAGKKAGEDGYMNPIAAGDVLMSDQYINNEIFTKTNRSGLDKDLRDLLRKKGFGTELKDNTHDIEGTPGNIKRFKDLYNSDPEVKAYVDSKYTPA